MKIVYIAHCIGASTKEGIEENLSDLRRIVRRINLLYPEIVPFVPYYADVVSLNDMNPEERKRGIENDHAILGRSGLVDELWLTGPKLSGGMVSEGAIAEKMNIPIVNMIGLL